MASLRAISLTTGARRPGLDALRAAATILVVLLHAGVPYTIAPMPGLAWPVRHTAVSPSVDLLFWGIEGAIMPLFFFLSGYGAAQSLAGKPEQFLSSRWRRLGWPLMGAAIVLLPIEFYIWLTGWALDGQIPWQKLRSLKLDSYHTDLWGLSHLWYLEYLLLYSVLLWAGKRWWNGRSQSPPSATAGTLLRSVAQLPCLFALASIILWFAPEVVVGFQHSFLPVPMKFLYSGLFFAAGIAEFHHPSRSSIRSTAGLAIAGMILIGLLPWIHRQAAEPLIAGPRWMLAIGLATYAFLVTRAAWRLAWDSKSTISPATDYLVRASFWVYLVHHPLVAIWQIVLRNTGWPGLPQFTMVSLGTLVTSLASYELFVRHTWLGAFLDGRKAVPSAPTLKPATPAEIPARRAA
jgi:peptidoglycan/LPS O-acetylase OafA/YrhL